jgi:hypothetical protein
MATRVPMVPGIHRAYPAPRRLPEQVSIFLSNGLTRKIIEAKFLNAGVEAKSYPIDWCYQGRILGRMPVRETKGTHGIREEFFKERIEIE